MSPIDVVTRSLLLHGSVIATLAACGGTPRADAVRVRSPVATAPASPPEQHHLSELEHEHAPARHLLAIDWNSVSIASDADAQALWRQIAPTGDDWDDKLQEIPGDSPVAHALAVALLREGNFQCTPPVATPTCHPVVEVAVPSSTATLADPCLRRLIALWALDELTSAELPRVLAALQGIAALPPPESQLVAAAIKAIPATDQDARFDLLARAWAAGHHEIVTTRLGELDEPHVVAAATQLHVGAALDLLTVGSHRKVFVAAILDERMATDARVQALVELLASASDGKLDADTRATLVAATRSADCTVAAAAARELDSRGEHRFAPVRPHARAAAPMMRGLCVLASFEHAQRADEPSLLSSWLAPRGLEVVKATYDPLRAFDRDSDAEPRAERSFDLVARADAMLPELDTLVRAFRHCTGTTCITDDTEVRVTFKPGSDGELRLARLELDELPPCRDSAAISTP